MEYNKRGEVFLLITDVHESPSFSGRVDYQKELMVVKSKITEFIAKYNSEYNVNLVFLGDIFDRSYRDVDKALNACSYYLTLSQYVKKVYSLVGNHEITYNKNNPFWYMVSSIESDVVRSDKVVAPRGFHDFIHVQDVIECGNVSFYCNHFGTGTREPNDYDRVNIGLYHQDLIYDKAMSIARMKGNDNHYDYIKTLPNDKKLPYNYVFAGHNHTIIGKITIGDMEVYNLGTLGRTSQLEVDDNLERDIPAVVIEDGVFSRIESNTFNLLPREECVIEEVVEKAKERRKKIKQSKDLIADYNTGERPVDNLKSQLDFPVVHDVIDSIINKTKDEHYERLCREVDEIVS